MPDLSATLGELTDDVIQTLLGYTQAQEQSTYLTSAVTHDDVSLPVASINGFGRGQVEIGNELIWVEQVAGSTLTVPPYGRGFRSTTAAAHTSGDRVVFRPLFPRSSVRREINNAIAMVSEALYGISVADLVFDPATVGYDLPTADFPDLDEVLSLSWTLDTGSDVMVPVKRFRLDRYADTALFPSGRALFVYDPILPGATVRVVFKQAPQLFASDATDADQLTTSTNLEATTRDLLVLGAVASLAWGADLSKVSAVGVSPDQLDESRAPGSSSTMARQLFQKFQLRLEAERDNLLARVPTIIRYER